MNFLEIFRTIDWSCFQNFTDLGSTIYIICEVFDSNVKTVGEKHAPFVTYKIEGKIEAWVTDDISFKPSNRGVFFKNMQTKLNPSMIGITSLRKGTLSTTSNTNF